MRTQQFPLVPVVPHPPRRRDKGLKTQRASKARGLNRQTLISVGDQPGFGEVELGFLLGLHLGVGQLYQHIGFYIHGRAWR